MSGTTVTYTAAGRCVIDANQGGTPSYADAPQVQRTITVRKIPESISFTAPSSGAVWSSAGRSAIGGGRGPCRQDGSRCLDTCLIPSS